MRKPFGGVVENVELLCDGEGAIWSWLINGKQVEEL